MPKNKAGVDNKYLKSIEGQYAEYAYELRETFIIMNLSSQFQNVNKELHNDFLEHRDKVSAESYSLSEHGEEAIKPIRYINGTIKASTVGIPYEMYRRSEEFHDKFVRMLDEQRTKEGMENYQDYLDIVGLETTIEPGLYIEAYMNSMHLSQLVDIIGGGPKVAKLGPKAIEEALRKPDGSGFFVPYMGICKAVKTLWEVEVEKIKNQRLGWSPEAEKEFLRKYKDALKLFNDNFEALREVVAKNPGIYDDYLDNPANHLVDYARDHNKEYAQLKGQIKAIENGWSVEELPILGIVEELSHMGVIQEKRLALDEKLKKTEAIIVSYNKELSDLPGEIEFLKSQKDNNDRKLKEFDELNKDLIDRYKAYEDRLVQLNADKDKEKDKKAKEKEIDEFKKANKALVNEYEAYNKQRTELDNNTIINKKEERLKDLPNEIEKAKAFVVAIKETKEDYKEFHEECKKIKDRVYNKKVISQKDKREIIEAIDRFLADVGDLIETPEYGKKRWDDAWINTQIKPMFNKIYEAYDTGITPDIADNEYAKDRLKLIIDIYGPKPLHHQEWETNKVISKDDMLKNFPRYETNDIPFSEKEMAFLSMAGTLLAKEEIIAANNGQDRDFENVLATSSTRWLEDVSVNADGPRENFSEYQFVAAKGRENALNAMKNYANGDSKDLCEIIYNGFINISNSNDRLTTYDDICIHQYGMLSTFTDLLRKDAKLREDFYKYNESLEPGKRVDFEKVYAIRNYAKMRLDAKDAEYKFKALTKEISDNIKKDPKFYEEDEINRNEVLLGLYERRSRQGRVINEMFVAADLMTRARADVYERNQKYVSDVAKVNGKDKKAALAVEDEQYKFLRENVKLNPAFVYMGSEEGKNAFVDFVDMLSDKYGAKFSPETGKLVNEKGNFETDIAYKAELNKFICELANKQILKDLKNNDLDKDKMRELAGKYMLNNYRINLCDNQIKTGVTEQYVDFSQKGTMASIEMYKSMETSIKAFVSNMDMSDVNSREFAKVLENGKESLADTTKNLELLLEAKKWADPKMRENLKLPALDDAVTALENANKGVMFGSKEYKNILRDFKKLNEDIKKAEEEFKQAENFTYDARGFAAREQELINRLDSYIERKDEELKTQQENKKNQNSLNRRNVAAEAKTALANRLKKEVKAPTISKEGREDAKILEEYVKLSQAEDTRIIDRGIIEKPSGMEILKNSMDEADYQRVKNAKILNESNKDDLNMRSVQEAYVGTVRDALYYEILKKAFAPKEKDSKASLAEKDVKLKVILKNSNNSSIKSRIDKVMDTKYGKRLAQYLLNDAVNPDLKPEDYKGTMSHDSIIMARDQVFKNCFDEEMAKYKEYMTTADKQLDKMYKERNRSNDIKLKLKEIEAMEKNIGNLISLCDQISSNALDDSKVEFANAKNARMEKQAARDKAREEKKAAHNAKKQAANPGVVNNNAAVNNGANKAPQNKNLPKNGPAMGGPKH